MRGLGSSVPAFLDVFLFCFLFHFFYTTRIISVCSVRCLHLLAVCYPLGLACLTACKKRGKITSRITTHTAYRELNSGVHPRVSVLMREKKKCAGKLSKDTQC